jgi:transposase
MDTVHPHAAGLDVGSTFHVVAVPAHLSQEHVRTFRSFTGDLHLLAEWLEGVGITTIAMESTGIYWIPVFEILEACGFEVLLVNARDVKNVPGRKTDVNDAQWLQQLHQFGLLRGSFRPHERVIQLRALIRHRDRLIESGATHIQLMQKALMQMNVQLQHAVPDITGLTGMRIIRAIVEGQHDPTVLAQYRDGRCKASVETIREALTGNYRPEHVFALRHALAIYDFLHGRIAECDAEIASVLEVLNTDRAAPAEPLPAVRHQRGKNEPRFEVRRALCTLLSADLSQIHGLGPYTVLRLIAECGDDMSKWPTAKHFTSWLTLAPATRSPAAVSSARKRAAPQTGPPSCSGWSPSTSGRPKRHSVHSTAASPHVSERPRPGRNGALAARGRALQTHLHGRISCGPTYLKRLSER